MDGQVRPRIRGTAYVNAEATLILDPADPFAMGIRRMSDSHASASSSIGGGVIGTACAYYLSRAGWQVTVVDRARIGGGSSHGNCGLVCPSHVLPLAEPGMVGQALERAVPEELAVRDQAAARPGALVVAAPLRPPLQRARHDRGRPRHPAAARVVAASSIAS